MPEPPRKRTAGKDEAKKAIPIRTHEQLAAKTAEIVAELNANPDLASAMLINPAAAIQESGYELAPELIAHVMETVRHSRSTAERAGALQSRLERELGEPVQIQNPAWLKSVLFEKLKLEPLATESAEPVYRAAIAGDLLKRLQKYRPALRRANVKTPEPLHGVAIQVDLTHKSPLRFDLDAKLPPLARAEYPPENVDLNTLYFYKDSHPLVRPLIELAVIARSSYPLHSPDSYRKIRWGEQPNPLRSWVKSVRFAQK